MAAPCRYAGWRHYRNRDEFDFADTAEGHRSRLAA
jgi:hypothetical protein